MPAILVVLLAFLVAALPAQLRQRASAGPAAADLPAPPGWLGAGVPPDWRADLQGVAVERVARYRRQEAAGTMDAFVGWYDVAAAGAGDLTDARNRPYVARDWRRAGLLEAPGYTEVVLRPAPGATGPDSRTRLVWWWYAVNGEATSSRVRAKVGELAALVSGQPVRQAYVALSVPADGNAADARGTLRSVAPSFCRAAGVPCPAMPGEAPAPVARRGGPSPRD